MGVELLVMMAAGAVMGGTVSAATGGDFWKGAALGSLTGGIGVGIERAIGGPLTDKARTKAPPSYSEVTGKTQEQIDAANAEKARAVMLSGGNTSILTGNTYGSLMGGSSSAGADSGGSLRKRLTGG